jgi:hypothetical protein
MFMRIYVELYNNFISLNFFLKIKKNKKIIIKFLKIKKINLFLDITYLDIFFIFCGNFIYF